ncbi:MAG: restriction endonuclease subunit S [Acholeplasmataceae bacterium]|nr:restriction endonuclease subunit S [Acholeplasmataceae bacterium]
MSKWKPVKLGEICEIVTGSTPSTLKQEYWDGSFYWVTPAEISDGDYYIERTQRKLTEAGISSAGLRIMPVGTVLLSSRAPIGKVAITAVEMACNQGFKNLICEEKIHNRFLYYFLKNNKHYLNSLGRGATFKEISKSIVCEIEIPLPPLEEQKRIANILDKASNLIDLRKQQLEKMDLLIKSKFIEMFGDPVINPKGWEVKKIADIADVKIGPFGSLLHLEDYVEDGHPLINPSHISNDIITYDSKKTITDEKYEEMKPYHLQINDIVLGRRGEIGRCAIVKQNGFMCGTGSLLIRIKNNYLPIIMQKIISHPSFKGFLKDKSVGVTMDNLNAGTISNLKIFLPPIELQNQFAEFVEQVEKQKAVMQQSLEKMETNHKALMQEYFG